ncbi:MAG: ATP-binding protein [Mucilaginibacter polytrichastri]|nr:ATP-binding protein [Mucilaginibacter polytrichastri]
MNQSPISDNELFTLQLPSKTESITQVEHLVEELCTRYNVSDDTFANMMTCLNEVTNNAIIHGNKGDADKKVYVNAEVIDQRRIVWTITDEGAGFDYAKLPDPTAPENLENLTGRGVFIVRQLADQCIFNQKGNTVELHFKI